MERQKRVGIMQPYFAPGLGYFDLISLCDEWIVFDTPNYRPKSWMSRNRILHPSSGWQYIKAQTGKVHRGTAIKDVALSPGREWRDLILRQLEHYRRTAPFFAETRAILEDGLYSEEASLTKLCVVLLEKVCQRLDMPFQYSLFSEMELELGPVTGPGDWALRISEAVGATEYVNPPGGRDLFDRDAFSEVGVRLMIREFDDLRYEPVGYEYIPSLSIVDVMMWCSPRMISEHLARQRLAFQTSADAS